MNKHHKSIFFRPAAAAGGSTPVQSTGGKFLVASTNATDTIAFPGNITAGNTVVFTVGTFEGGALAPVSILIGGTAAVQDAVLQSTANVNYTTAIWRATNVTGGTPNIVITWDSNHSGSYYSGSAEEWSNFLASPVDAVPTPVKVTATSTSITSAVTAQAKEVVYAICTTQVAGAAGLAGPTSGFTQTALDTGGINVPVACGYKVVSATGAQAAAWTASGSVELNAIMVTYKTN